jgi:creatinine amidohydrolase
MQLQTCTWHAVEAYLVQSQGIIMPIGSTEQHGPTGLIGTDAICAEEVARGVGEVTGSMVAPTISVGMAQHHLAFPGSITLRPSTLIAVIQDMIASLSRAGFRRFYFLNGHGGNVATVSAAFSEIYADRSLQFAGRDNTPEIQLRLKNWYDVDSVKDISKALYPGVEGSHATPSEVSLTQHFYPEDVQPRPLEPRVAPNGGFADADDYRRNFPDGRIGSDPGLSTAEAGKRLYDASVAALADDYRRWLGQG